MEPILVLIRVLKIQDLRIRPWYNGLLSRFRCMHRGLILTVHFCSSSSLYYSIQNSIQNIFSSQVLWEAQEPIFPILMVLAEDKDQAYEEQDKVNQRRVDQDREDQDKVVQDKADQDKDIT